MGGELSMRAPDVWRSMNGTGRIKIGKGHVVGEGALKLVRDVLETGTLIDQALRGKFSGPGKTALDFDSVTGTYRITQSLEAWMHRRVAADSKPGQTVLELGAGTLNHLRFESPDETYDVVDYVSMHAYYQEYDGDRDSFLGCAVDDHVATLIRLHGSKPVANRPWLLRPSHCQDLNAAKATLGRPAGKARCATVETRFAQ
jgi:hypothetical protein